MFYRKSLALGLGILSLLGALAPAAQAGIAQLGDAQFQVTRDFIILPNTKTVCFERGVLVDYKDAGDGACCLYVQAEKAHARVLQANTRTLKLSGQSAGGSWGSSMTLKDSTFSTLVCSNSINPSNVDYVFGRYLRLMPSKPEVATLDDAPAASKAKPADSTVNVAI